MAKLSLTVLIEEQVVWDVIEVNSSTKVTDIFNRTKYAKLQGHFYQAPSSVAYLPDDEEQCRRAVHEVYKSGGAQRMFPARTVGYYFKPPIEDERIHVVFLMNLLTNGKIKHYLQVRTRFSRAYIDDATQYRVINEVDDLLKDSWNGYTSSIITIYTAAMGKWHENDLFNSENNITCLWRERSPGAAAYGPNTVLEELREKLAKPRVLTDVRL